MRRRRLAFLVTLFSTLLVGASVSSTPVAGATTTELAVGQAATIGGHITAEAPTTVGAAARNAAKAAAGATDVVGSPAFRPTIDQAALDALKAAAPASPAARSAAPLAPPLVTLAPFEAADGSMCAFGCRPPDPIIAAGGGVSQQVVHVGNSFVNVFDHAGNALSFSTLNAFMGLPPPPTFNQLLFDPRVIYDEAWNRWIVTADEFSQSSTVQLFDMAISLTDDATGPFYIYRFNVTSFANDFFDYPSLGMDQDAVIVTANIFTPTAFKYAEAIGFAKSRLYNGQGFFVPVFIGLAGTLQPPHVVQLDQSPSTFLIAARPSGSTLQLYRGNDLANAFAASIVLQANVAVPAYSPPPNASQPGTTAQLDTLDARFVGVSTQWGNWLYNAHSVALGNSAVRWYKINTSTSAVAQTGFVFETGPSSDWNASITANVFDEIFLTWSSVDSTASGYQASLVVSGKQSADPAIPPRPLIYTSPDFSTQGRWGDYSGIALDPVGVAGCTSFRRAWLVNQATISNDLWDTQAAQAGFC